MSFSRVASLGRISVSDRHHCNAVASRHDPLGLAGASDSAFRTISKRLNVASRAALFHDPLERLRPFAEAIN
jgi:hypothetical protein